MHNYLFMDLLLNSNEVSTPKSQEDFVKIINFLIKELVGDAFELKTNITEDNTFKISITGLPDENKKVYQISFDIGLFKMIYDVLYVLLSNESFFPNIGKASEKFKIPTIELPNWTFLDMAMANNEPVYFDEERKELHHFIYTLCLHFLARHEIRHIANGHIDYLVNINNTEFIENTNNGLTPTDSQTLEMDVDSCVFTGFLDGLINIPQQLLFVPEKLRDHENIFESVLFCSKILFYCLPSKKISKTEEIVSASHPNSTLRYFFSFTAGLSFIRDLHPDLFELFGKTYQKSWSFFEIIHEQGLMDFDKFIADYNWTMSDEGQDYANKIWNNWNVWVPKLEPYTYLKLAPPEE
jgi:hypothetical protein